MYNQYKMIDIFYIPSFILSLCLVFEIQCVPYGPFRPGLATFQGLDSPMPSTAQRGCTINSAAADKMPTRIGDEFLLSTYYVSGTLRVPGNLSFTSILSASILPVLQMDSSGFRNSLSPSPPAGQRQNLKSELGD